VGLAQRAADAGEQLGGGFLNVLSKLASPGSSDDSAAAPASGEAAGPAPQASRTQSWCEKLMSWLGSSGSSSDLQMTLSLDSLDQPHVSAEGKNAEAVEAALAQDPTWLQEFRELALDRAAELGGGASGSPDAAPLTLNISQRDGQVQAAWQ
jgi:hypothetical protein